jgi:putative ABC transport system permease protein
VLRQGSLPAIAGIALGIPCALAASRVLRSMLFGVGAVDPLVYGGVGIGLALLVLAAAMGPAGRAAAVDPVEAMRTA